MLKWIIALAKTCWSCGTPISGGEVCDACNKGPGLK